MIKWLTALFFISLHSIHILFAQTPDQESELVKTTSQTILVKVVSFVQPEGSLEAALNKLSDEQKISISFSPEKISSVKLKAKKYSNEKMALILAEMLQNSGFTFLMVGRVIVIFEDSDTNKSLEEKKDSITTQKPSAAKPKPDNAGIIKKYSYSSEMNLSKLPSSERKKIHNLYKREMEWAATHLRPGQKSLSDTTGASKSNFRNRIRKDFYVKAGIALLKYIPSVKSSGDETWRRELNFNTKVPLSGKPMISAGIIYNQMMIGAGFSYEKLVVTGRGRAIFPKGNSGKADTANVYFRDEYSIYSIPVQLTIFRQYNNFIYGINPGIEFCYNRSGFVQNSKFAEYTKLKSQTFSEKTNTFGLRTSINLIGGYLFLPNMAVMLSGGYSYYATALVKNSFYTLRPHSLNFELSYVYLMDKSDFRSIFRR
ncbi:MAG: hypothetical protein ACK40G_00715 [Cytophagaceae bacterium]